MTTPTSSRHRNGRMTSAQPQFPERTAQIDKLSPYNDVWKVQKPDGTYIENLTEHEAKLIAQAPNLLRSVKALVALCYAADCYGDAILDAVEIFKQLGIDSIPQHEPNGDHL